MKFKSRHHKTENTFRFQAFSERIAAVNVDVSHRIDRRHKFEDLGETESYFGTALRKWTELNCTDDFDAFRREISGCIQTFAQLVHSKEQVVTALHKHLHIPESRALEPLLDLVVQLARDLQGDFYEHFDEFFKTITDLLTSNLLDSEILEKVFTCLSYLFKFLWRYMVKDFQHIYRLYSPLLKSSCKEYVRKFASESFAYLMRKVKDRHALFEFMFSLLDEAPEHTYGVGQLLFEMLRGVRQQLHSCASEVLPLLLRCLNTVDNSSSSAGTLPAEAEQRLSAMQHAFQLTANYLDKEHSGLVVDVLLAHIDKLLSEEPTTPVQLGLCLRRALTLLADWTSYKGAVLVHDGKQIAEMLVKCLAIVGANVASADPLLAAVMLQIVTNLLLHRRDMPVHIVSRLLSAVYESGCHRQSLLNFSRAMLSYTMFEKDVLPRLLRYLESGLGDATYLSSVAIDAPTLHTSVVGQETLVFVTQLVLHRHPLRLDASAGIHASSASSKLTLGVLAAPDITAESRASGSTAIGKLIVHCLAGPSFDISEDRSTFWAALVCLPHFSLEDRSGIVTLLLSHLQSISCKMLSLPSSTNGDTSIHNGLFLSFSQLVQTLTGLTSFDGIWKNMDALKMSELIRRHAASSHVLRAADFYFTSALEATNRDDLSSPAAKALCRDVRLSMLTCLKEQLSSHCSEIRRLTLRILCCLTCDLDIPNAVDINADRAGGVYKICLQAEEAECNVQSYREKLVKLRKLDYSNVQSQLPAGGSENDVPLRYLLGVTYVNFSLLWEPAIELVRTYAVGLPRQAFWDVYGPALQRAAQLCEEQASGGSSFQGEHVLPALTHRKARQQCEPATNAEEGALSRATTPDGSVSLAALVAAASEKLSHLSMPGMPGGASAGRPDHFNHRELLWRAMHSFADCCESRSRLLVPLFFSFLEKEYYLADIYAAPMEDVCRRRGDCLPLGVDEAVSASANKNTKGQKSTRPRGAAGTLLAHLTLFSKFSNPRSLYKESQLRALYLDLLCHRDVKVQRLALSCLLAYKDGHVTPYSELLQAMLDDAKFKDTLVTFGSTVPSEGSEAQSPKEADRAAVVPLVIRLLYARMLAKTGKDTTGKGKARVRRSIVLRFLATCRRDELHVFFDLLFEPFKRYITQPDQLSQHLDIVAVKEVDPRRLIPSLRRQVGVICALETVIEKLAHLLLQQGTGGGHCYARDTLHVVTGVARQCSSLLDRRAEIAPGSVNALKLHLRPACLTRLSQFFTVFDSYDFTSSEIDAIFDAAVWPQLSKLSSEGVYSPTPLLCLLHNWSSNVRYFPLLAKCWLPDPAVSPLSCLMALLVAKSTQPAVCDMIMEIVSNLLTADPEDASSSMEVDGEPCKPTPRPLTVNDVVQIVAVSTSSSSLSEVKGETPSYGCCLVLPCVPFILEHITKAVQSFKSSTGNDRKSKFPVQELSILSRISSYVRDAEQSTVLVSLLLPFLCRGTRLSENAQVDIIESISNLVKLASDLGSLESGFSELLSTVTARVARDAVVSLYKKLSQLDESRWKHAADIVVKLNSWHHRRLDEPDYDTRLAAFQTINREGSSSVFCDMVIIRSCLYLILTADDLSLRDNAAFTLRNLIQHMPEERFSTVIVQHLLPDLRLGLRNKSETVRNEFFSILAALVRKFPKEVPLCDFVALGDSVDLEVDFFENLRHIQNHRKARALRRLAKHLSLVPVRAASVTAYLLPIVKSFLDDEALSNDSNLMDAAVEAIGALCARLPWRAYLLQLRRQIQQLDRDLAKQKLAVRVFVAVLDAFHFNLLPALENKEAKVAVPTRALSETEVDVTQSTSTVDNEDSDESLNPDDGAQPMLSPVIEVQQCTPQAAARIRATLLNDIIPKLQETLTRKVASDDEHKLTRTGHVEDSEVLRVPVALALLKLFQKLPDDVLSQHLSGLLLKVCAFLRSRSRDIRHAARETLTKMLDCLGPAKFTFVLKELRETLTRGYQLHVLSFTVHSLLKSMTPKLESGALDSCLDSLTALFNEELFGRVSEEKEVEGITGKLFEAKTSKSYDSYAIVARFVSPGSLVRFIQPLKEVVDGTHSNKVIKKAHEALRKVLVGLVANEGMPAQTCLIFIHGIVTEALPMLQAKMDASQHDNPVSAAMPSSRLRPPSTLLLPKTPGRAAPQAVVNKKTNVHIIIEFGLTFLHMLLKKGKVAAASADHLRMLDPFVEPLAGCLSSKHVRVAATSLHCLFWLCRFPLPSLRQHIRSIVESLFVTLKNYTSAGAAKGDNLELVTMCFKTITVIVRDVDYHTIDDGQLLVLLTYVEADLHDHSRQAAAFSLLKAILTRKLLVPEMYDVIEKVASLSVRSEAPHVQLQCRQVVLQFVLDYPLGRKVRRYLEFYITNLQYTAESGRESVLEMMASLFSSFPQSLLAQFSGMFFVPLAQALINDESARCRRLTALALHLLLSKLDSTSRDELLAVALLWLKEPKVLIKRLAAQVLGIFVEVEAARFERHLPTLLPLLEQYLEPGRYVVQQEQCSMETAGAVKKGACDTATDLLLFNMLTLLLKILRDCPASADAKFATLNQPVWENVQRHLLHPHSWVRLTAAQLYGQLFSLIDAKDLTSLVGTANGGSSQNGSAMAPGPTSNAAIPLPLMWQNARKRVRDLSADFCTQLHSQLLSADLAAQIIKNLVYLAKVIKDIVPASKDLTSEEVDTGEVTQPKGHNLSIRWLIKRLCREANYEAALDPKSTIRRSSVFTWFAAVAIDLGAERLATDLSLMIPPLYRESVSEKVPIGVESLKSLAVEVMDHFKSVVGVEAFTQAYSSVRKTAADRKESRKRTQAVEAVSQPDVAARKKIKKNLGKKEAKKRRMTTQRPTKGFHPRGSAGNLQDGGLLDM